MTIRLLAITIAFTRAWLRIYTSRIPEQVASARRAEIESDIWQMLHDEDLPGEWQMGRVAMARLVNGIPDDIAWHLDHAPSGDQMLARRVVALTAATVLIVSLWAVPSLLFNGRREVADCAAAAPEPQTDADLRFEVMRCAGAFFASDR